MTDKIYFDHNASTPVDIQVTRAMCECLENVYGNPSSVHEVGQKAKQYVLQARKTLANFWGVKSNEIIFTSGGSEGISAILRGMINPGDHLITSDLEHACVWDTAHYLERQGAEVTFLSGGLQGGIDAEAVRQTIRPNTKLIALMAVNNETGVKTDIETIAQVALESGIPFFVDGVCQMGKELLKIPAGVSAYCISGHKFHAPKGIGALFVRKGLKFQPLIIGGGQEYGLRGGTPNVPGIVGLAKAVERIEEELPEALTRMQEWRERFEQTVLEQVEGAQVNGTGPRACNTTNFSFSGIDGESLLINLDRQGLLVSHGSACDAGAREPSRILLNMGVERELVMSAIRVSFSRTTTEEEMERATKILIQVIKEMRTQTSKL